jgi:hypothetical protein
MADKKDSPPAKSRRGEKPAGQDLLSDLASFRRETIKVSEKEQEAWKQELSRRPAEPDQKKKEAEEEEESAADAAEPVKESRWDRIQRQEKKKKLALGALAACALVLLWQFDLGVKVKSMLSSLTAPRPPPTPVAPPTTPPDTQMLTEAYLVCRLEIRWAQSRVAWKPPAPDPFVCDWTSLNGPVTLLGPPGDVDPLERCVQLGAGSAAHPRQALLAALSQFARSAVRPDERLLVDAVLDDPATIAARGRVAIEQGKGPGWSYRIPLVTGIATFESGGDAARARELVAQSAADGPPEDPWPARALGLVDAARGHAGDAIETIKKRWAARPDGVMTGYQLAWQQVQAGKAAEADAVLEKLGALPQDGGAARLVRAVMAAGAGAWPRYKSLAEALDADAAKLPAPIQSRIQGLKGQALLVEDPNQQKLARQFLTTSLELDRTCSWIDLSLARVLVKQKALGEAAGAYHRYLRRNPRAVPVRRELADALVEGRYFFHALGEFQELVNADGPRPEYVKGFTLAAEEIGRPDLVRYAMDRGRR